MKNSVISGRVPVFVFFALFYGFLCFFVQRNLLSGFSAYQGGCFGDNYRAAVVLTMLSVFSLLLCFFVFVCDVFSLFRYPSNGKRTARLVFDLALSGVSAVWFLFTGWSGKAGQSGGFFDAAVIPVALICFAALVYKQIRELKESGFEREKKTLFIFNVFFFMFICVFGILFFDAILLFSILSADRFQGAAVLPAVITAFISVHSVAYGLIKSRGNESDLRHALDKTLTVLLGISFVWFVIFTLTPVGILLRDSGAATTCFDGFIFTAPLQALILCVGFFIPAEIRAPEIRPAPQTAPSE